MEDVISREVICQFLADNAFEVVDDRYVSGGFTHEYLDDLDIKIEAHSDKWMLFIGRDKELKQWDIETDENIRVRGIYIATNGEMKTLLKQLNVV